MPLPEAEDESVLDRAAPPPDRVVAYGAEPDQVADVYAAGAGGAARPLLVLIHGGFWKPQYGRGQIGPMASALAAAGWTVAAIGYRRRPGDPFATVEDVRNALAALPARVDGHDGRMLVIGHSAGGHLALLMAAASPTPALAGVLAMAPAADLAMAHALGLGGGAVAAFLGTAPSPAHRAIDPVQGPSPRVPTVLLHGDADAVVPLEVGEAYRRVHPDVPLQRLEGCGHFGVIDPLGAYWPRVVAAIETLAAT